MLEEEVPVGVLQAVVPEKDAVVFRNLLKSVEHQVDHILEVAEDKKRKMIGENDTAHEVDACIDHLRLALRDMRRVDVGGLEGGEQQLNWSCIIGMWAGEEHRHLQASQQVQGALAGMIGCIVQQ